MQRGTPWTPLMWGRLCKDLNHLCCARNRAAAAAAATEISRSSVPRPHSWTGSGPPNSRLSLRQLRPGPTLPPPTTLLLGSEVKVSLRHQCVRLVPRGVLSKPATPEGQEALRVETRRMAGCPRSCRTSLSSFPSGPPTSQLVSVQFVFRVSGHKGSSCVSLL